MDPDLELALELLDAADAETSRRWSADGHASTLKSDGSPVTEADIAAENAILRLLRRARPDDGFLGEEVGAHGGRNARRWIVDGIDGTRFFAGGSTSWGTLLALEVDGAVVLGVCSSPIQDTRWWGARGSGAFKARRDGSDVVEIRVSDRATPGPANVACLPDVEGFPEKDRAAVQHIVEGRPHDRNWSHQLAVAEGDLDVCVWLAGDIWDHAAPSIIVEEAGGRFTDFTGGTRLDTRTAIYSNGRCHESFLAALKRD